MSELERTVEKLVIATLRGNSVTSTEIMKQVNEKVRRNVPRDVLVKTVGSVMKRINLVKRKINNVIYFSLK